MDLGKKIRTHNTGLAKVAVQFSADTFVVKIATFAKPENVSGNCTELHLNYQTEEILNYNENFNYD